MILCDAGPLVALALPEDQAHQAVVAVWQELNEPIVTTWVCVGEAMHLVGSRGHPVLWAYLAGEMEFYDPTPVTARMRELMRKYADTPMDLGDASLVAAAEALGLTRVLTLDQHFHAYRINDRRPFDVVP